MEKTRFFNLIDQISETALKDKWIPIYNSELDYFEWSKKPLSKNSNLVKVAEETAFYFNHKGKIEGLAVEYLRSNFIAHNEAFKDLPKIFAKKVDDRIFTIKSGQKESRSYLVGLSESLKADVYKEIAINDNRDVLERLIAVAVKN